tara:strand:+ start:7579 stop:7833 length:255 start_codon:yes stop_codon:yes gene_type:complete
MKTEALQKKESINFEQFYQTLEDDPTLLEESIEILLEMVNFEKKSVKKIALFIKENSRNLYNEISELSKSSQNKGNTSSCCGGH